MADIGPFSVGYPVIFRSGGDTTRDAFGKHIQEIERIYGYLNALDVGKMSSRLFTDAMQNHVNSETPHPNWKPSITMSDITGDLAASRVVGELTRATINTSKITGLTAFVNGLISQIPEPTDKGDGITEIVAPNADNTNGYVKFKNGLMIQWGSQTRTAPFSETTYNVTFPRFFEKNCMNVTLTMEVEKRNSMGYIDAGVQLIYDTINKAGFSYFLGHYRESPIGNYDGSIGVSYLAIGI